MKCYVPVKNQFIATKIGNEISFDLTRRNDLAAQILIESGMEVCTFKSFGGGVIG